MNSRSKRLAPAGLALLLIFTSVLTFGQGITTGSISGTVEDPQQAVVSGAKVVATNTATNVQYTAESDSRGFYALRGLPVGAYTVTIDAAKFSKLKVDGVVVNSNRDSALGARTISIGTTETVTVEDTAPLVESNSIQITTSFNSKKVTDLPINNGVDQLAYLVPGVVPTGDLAFGNSNGASFAANGQRGRSTNFQIDGQGNNDNSVTGPQLALANQDTIAEFQVSTNYTAEYGRNQGSVLNIVTKSGTNAFHGSAFEFHSNRLFDSFANEEKSPFLGFCPEGMSTAGPDGVTATPDDCNAAEKPQHIRNRYGFTVGGPVLKDKVWFYGSYQADKIRTSGVFNSGAFTLPSPSGLAALQAAFPNNAGVAALAAIGPYSRSGITYNNPQVTNVTSGGVSVPVEFATMSRSVAQPLNQHEFSTRGDWQVTSKDRIFGRYIYQTNDFPNAAQFRVGGFAVGEAIDVPAKNHQIAADWTRTWSSNFVNQARFSYGKLDVSFQQNDDNPNCKVSDPTGCDFDVNFIATQNGLPLSFFGAPNTLPQGRGVNNYQYSDNATWQKGRHTWKFGGEFDHQNSPSPFLPNFNGQYFFQNIDDFLDNTPSRFRLADGVFQQNYKEKDLAFYFQDDWRVKDNLTLNLGLRWEWQQQAINLLHDSSLAQQRSANPFWNTSLPDSATIVPKFDQDLNNFGPVAGFAWTPRIWQGLFGHDKTVIRGGFAIKYDPAFYNLFLNVGTSPPAVNLGDLRTGVIPGIPNGAANGGDIRTALLSTIPSNCGTSTCDPRFRSQTRVAPDFHNPYSEQWSLGVQRELNSHMAAEVRYVGNHGVGLFQTFNSNVALTPLIDAGFSNLIPAGLTPCTTPGTPGVASGYQDCDARNVLTRGNTAFSLYHGLQTRLDVQNWRGLGANLSYTFSKAIDNSSEVFSTFAGGQGIVGSQNPFDANRGERGVSGTDFPHVFTAAITYELPWLKSQQGVLGHILGGWQANTVYRFTSGQPWTPLQFKTSTLCDSTGTISTTVDTCRPILGAVAAPIDSVGFCSDESASDCGITDLATGAPTSFSAVHWIQNDDTAAAFFGSPFLGVGRNTLRGETINNVNFGVFKDTKISEGVTLQFQANAYNLFNRQYRGVPDPFVDDVSSDINPLTGTTFTTFAHTFANSSGNLNTNATESGIARRRLIFGLKVLF